MKTILKDLINKLQAVDILIIVFTQFLSILSIIFSIEIKASSALILVNLFLAGVIILLSKIVHTKQSKLLKNIFAWYPIPMIFFLFKEVYYIIQLSNRVDWDNILIIIDRAILSTDPTVWLMQFANPVVTEILQIAYTSYYFLMLTVGIELFVRKEHQKFSFAVFTVVYGFVLSYLGYLAFPAVGPRFTLHDFYSLNTELPGLFFTEALRDFVNAGESIPKGALNAMAIAQRDAFPSGHTQMTIITMYFAQKYKLTCRYLIHILGILLIVSTVYLRYHYVIDLIGGVVFMWITLWTAPKLVKWWEQFKINLT